MNKNGIIVVGANSKIFKIFISKYYQKNNDYFLYSRSDPKLKFTYVFYKWSLNQTLNLNQIKNYKKLKILIFVHDWKKYNEQFHLSRFKKLIINIKKIEKKLKIEKKIYFSSFSSNKNSYNFYGKIKNKIEKKFYINNYKIVRISLITGSKKFFHYLKMKENSKKKIIVIPHSEEKFQIININNLCNKINKILHDKSKNKIYNLGSKKRFSLKELIIKISKKQKHIFIEINLNLVLIITRILSKFKLIDYRTYDSLKGLKRQIYYKDLY